MNRISPHKLNLELKTSAPDLPSAKRTYMNILSDIAPVFILVLKQLIMKLISQYREVGLKYPTHYVLL